MNTTHHILLTTLTGESFDEMHITPEGAHYTRSVSRKACGEGCCWETDMEAFEWDETLKTPGYTVILDDSSGANFDISVLTAPYTKTFSCGCPVWWDLDNGITFPDHGE